MNPPGSSRQADFRLCRKSPSSLRSSALHVVAVRMQDLLLPAGLLPHTLSRVRQRTLGRRLIKLGLPLFVCMRFQDLFHSPSGVLFAFPSRYWFAIGRSRVFSLGGWSPHLQTGFHVSRPTCRHLSSTVFLLCTGLSPTAATLSRAFH